MLSFLESLPPPGTTSVLCSLGNSSQGASAKPKKKRAAAQARCTEVVDASGDVALGSVLAHLGEMRVRPAAPGGTQNYPHTPCCKRRRMLSV